ncbi:hypothetical protein [Leptospira andrefontaineae]|uniref:Uncharacterized protein n=1 Tax=Leptospira andrefontaineae TaxID=2484976 RepID=A0A4V3JGU7_9LEPT|nr:hypothetical protein [Leptospira andrefontaineae]TGK44558.1 hypothetical protein EHO65_00530 [Leptospira andrefontaineae]
MDKISNQELFFFIFRGLFEASCIIFILWLFFIKLKMLEHFKYIGKSSYILYLAFILLWGSAQILDRLQYSFPQKVSFYPLVRFAMFQHGRSGEIAESYSWFVRLPDGKVESFNPANTFTAIGFPSLSTRMDVLRRGLESKNEIVRSQSIKEANLWAKSVRTYYDKKYQKKINGLIFYKTILEGENNLSKSEIYTADFE